MLIPAVIRDDVSCRSGLWYPGSIPKRSTEQEAVIENYEMMVATLEDPNRAAQKTCKSVCLLEHVILQQLGLAICNVLVMMSHIYPLPC